MVKITLRNRIIVIMIGFSVFFISAFTVVEITSQLNSITNFNVYRSKLGAFICKNALEKAIPGASTVEDISPKGIFEDIITPFVESELIDHAALVSKEGDIVVSLPQAPNSFLTFEDKHHLEIIRSSPKSEKWLFSYVDKMAREVNIFVRFLRDDSYLLKLTYSMGNIQEALNQIYLPVIMTVIIIIVGNVIFAAILSRAVVSPIRMLNSITKEVSSGNLDMKVRIKTEDELQELGDTFNFMTVALKKMKERAENANPLTKLPGNLVIMEEVERRIKNNEKFTVIYGDLDNFKAFNDIYGIHQGDAAIKMTADIMKEAIQKYGNPTDLLGHEGGDDFILITTPDKADKIARFVMERFDLIIKSLYKKEDAQKGFLMAEDRDGKPRKFPIMTISLSGVTNKQRQFTSYAEVTNICAEVKKKVKALEKSAWFVDQRTNI